MALGSVLRIALVGPFPPPYGGMASYCSRLKASIMSQGHQCRPIALSSARDGPWRGVKRLVSFLLASVRVSRAGVNIVHCITGSQFNLMANALPLLAARLSRKASALSIVGGELPEVVSSSTWLKQKLLQIILSLPSKVVACHIENEHALRQLGVTSERILVISNALPQRSGEDALADILPDSALVFCDSHRPIIVSVTAWYPHYGAMELVQAAAGLRRLYPRLGLLLIFKEGGDTEFTKRFHAFLENRYLTEHVLVLHNVPSVMALLRRADVFVRTPHSEGDSMSVREALLEGLPVIASDVGYRPPGVVLFRPGDSDDLQVQLETVLTASRPPQNRRGNLDHEGELNLKHLIQMYQQLASPKSVNDN